MMPTPCQPHWTGIKGLIIIAAVRSGVKIGAGAVESHLFLCYSAPRAEVAQLAEHSPEKAGVDSSILSLGTTVRNYNDLAAVAYWWCLEGVCLFDWWASNCSIAASNSASSTAR